MESNIYTVIIALIAGLSGSGAWNYWQKKAEMKRVEEYSYKYECKARIDKLEDALNKSEMEKQLLQKHILELSTQIAELKTRLEMLEKK